MKSLSRLFGMLVLCVAMSVNAVSYVWTGNGFMGEQDFLWSNPFN